MRCGVWRLCSSILFVSGTKSPKNTKEGSRSEQEVKGKENKRQFGNVGGYAACRPGANVSYGWGVTMALAAAGVNARA